GSAIATGGARAASLHVGRAQHSPYFGETLGRGRDDGRPRPHAGRAEEQEGRQEQHDVTAGHTRILLQLPWGLRSASKEGLAMKMYVAGQWIDKSPKIEGRNSYGGKGIDTVPRAERADIERGLQS